VSARMPQTALARMFQSRFLRKYLGRPYGCMLWTSRKIFWNSQKQASTPLGVTTARGLRVLALSLWVGRWPQAEDCLRNLARLVKPGGYLFVSGVDLGVRSKVARKLGWRPVAELISDIHEGDPSLRRDWPLEYWGLEPFDQGRVDWKTRYASVFQPGGAFSEVK